MVEIIFRPPIAILLVAIGIIVIGFSTLLSKREKGRKILGLVLTVVIGVSLAVFLYRPTTVTVDEAGVSTRGPTSIQLVWDEVRNAYLEANLPSSPYRPTVRTRGIALGDYRTGRFLLSNGDSGMVLMERADRAVVLVTDLRTYVLAPMDMDVLVDAINTFRVLPLNE